MKEPLQLLDVRHLYKKFSRDIKYNMFYGIQDIFNQSLGRKQNYMHLRKKEFWSLHDINMQLYEGEILAIVGANGSGKTTLMRVISEIYPTDVGSIHIPANTRTTPIFTLRSGMQSLFTGLENIYIKGAMYGMTKEMIEGKIEFIKDFSELQDQLDRPFGNYSSGMRARLAYAIALATDPNIFIVDEALAVGDSVFKAKCFDNLKEFVQEPKKAVLFVSNNIRKVLKIATRVIIMDKGKIIYESADITKALTFYIENCLSHLEEEERDTRLQRVKDYDM